jgi:hypothetical protein
VEPVAETTDGYSDDVVDTEDPGKGTRPDSDATEDTSAESSAETRCLSCDTVVNPTVRFCPSCGADSPTDEPTGAQQTESRQSEPTTTDSVSPTLQAVAQDIKRRIDPDLDAAQTLCRTLSDGASDADELRLALEQTIQGLDQRDAVETALNPVDIGATDDTLKRAAEALEAQPTQLSTAIEALVDQLIQLETDHEEQGAAQKALVDDIDTVCSAAASTGAVTVRNVDGGSGLKQVASALETGKLTLRQSTTAVSSVIRDGPVGRPDSPVARELKAALRDQSDGTAIRSALDESVALLDEYAETRELLSGISDADIRTRIDSLSGELQQHDNTVYSQIWNRIRDLEAMLDGRADDIQRYAIYQELLFYDRTLVPRLSRPPADVDQANDQFVEAIQREVDEIEREYVSVRADHNHAIPNHFLMLADELANDAGQDIRRHPDRARGVLTGAEAILGNVRELYDRNEYSVMLRRLKS